MPLARLLPLALLPALLLPLPRPASPPRTLWTGPSGATAYSAPSPRAAILAQVPENQPLRVATVARSWGWGHTLLWNALPAYVPLSSAQNHPMAFTQATAALPRMPYAGAHAPMSLRATGATDEPAYLRAAPAFGAAHRALLPRGSALSIDAWATDAGGAAWYHATEATATGATSMGWVYGDAVTFDARTPVSPAALLSPLRGKGMWATYPLLQTSPVTAIVATARAAGLTRLYVEVARSNKGFYGGPGLAALLPAAHRAGIRVIAWVYPFLHDLPSDVTMTLAAATYTAPSGDRPDGLLTDVEENMSESAVRAYGQILRAILGPDELMAIATFPPQWSAGRSYPFAAAALSWNAIVPMDYWHLRGRAYTPTEVYNFVRDSVTQIRARTRPDEPVEVLGQMFDILQSGVNSPSGAEIAACAEAARDTGALGVSFFEWRHATPDEWAALTELPVAPIQ